MIVYLAGPMTGYPEFNRAGFAEGEGYALDRGWKVVSPQNTNPSHQGPCPTGERQTTAAGSHPYGCWVKASLRMLLDCDAVLMLPGWQASTGASLEHRVAHTSGMPVYEMLGGADASEDDHQACAGCGDRVYTLSSQGFCDGCVGDGTSVSGGSNPEAGR